MIVIPMAGLSERFKNAGYHKPKYMLEAGNKTLFFHTVSSFAQYFKTQDFMFIYRDISDTDIFLKNEVEKLGIINPIFINLGSTTTEGQADTVYIGLSKINTSRNEPITIFNIDTIRKNFTYPEFINNTDCNGYLEVFVGDGNGWSFIEPSLTASNRVARTTEKERISNLCSTGLYFFRTRELFEKAFNAGKSEKPKNEIYVAPLYNSLISDGHHIYFDLINSNDVIFSGTPSEYLHFKNICKKQKNTY